MSRAKGPKLTAARAHELFRYDPKSGWLTWRIDRGGIRAGERAGTRHHSRLGHWVRKVQVDGRAYKEHRVIWLMRKGVWPDPECDHKNNDGTDNRWRNLRLASRRQNMKNIRVSGRNRSGLKWVRTHRPGRYQASVGSVYLGVFDTPEAAHEVAKTYARKRDRQFFNHGARKHAARNKRAPARVTQAAR